MLSSASRLAAALLAVAALVAAPAAAADADAALAFPDDIQQWSLLHWFSLASMRDEKDLTDASRVAVPHDSSDPQPYPLTLARLSRLVAAFTSAQLRAQNAALQRSEWWPPAEKAAVGSGSPRRRRRDRRLGGGQTPLRPTTPTLTADDFAGAHVTKARLAPRSVLYVFGDLHGAFHSLVRDMRALRTAGVLGQDLAVKHQNLLVFCGDFADRGLYGP